MSQLTSPGLKYKASTTTNLKLGLDELSWLQYENDERIRLDRLGTFARTGLIINRRSGGQLEDDWIVAEDGSNAGYLVLGTSSLGQQVAVDPDGYVLRISGQHRPYTLVPPKTLSLVVPNDSTWRTLVMRRATTAYEPGTLAFTNSNAGLVGTSTALTRYAGSGEGGAHGTYIRIDAADQATLGASDGGQGAGIWELSSVTSDTVATMGRNATATASGVPFSIAGSYYVAEPASSVRDVHLRPAITFELVTRTRLPSNDDIVIADVQRSGGVMAIIDRRECSLAYGKRGEGVQGAELVPVLQSSTAGALSFVTDTVFASNAAVPLAFSMAETDDRQILCVRAKATVVHSALYNPRTGVAASPVVVANTTATSGASILYVPVSDGDYRHLCFYDDQDVIYYKASTDDGTTWGAATVVWDVSAVAGPPTLRQPFAILLRSHRIAVVAAYDAGDSTSNVVVSDTYGASWLTNSDEGWAVGGGITNSYCALAQDPVTGWVWKTAQFSSGIGGSLVPDETLTAEAADYTVTFADRLTSQSGPGAMFLNESGQAAVVLGEHNSIGDDVILHVSRIGACDLSDSSVDAVQFSNRPFKLILTGVGDVPPRPCALTTRDGGRWLGYFDTADGTNFTGDLVQVLLR